MTPKTPDYQLGWAVWAVLCGGKSPNLPCYITSRVHIIESQSRVPPIRSFLVKNDKSALAKVKAFNFTIFLTSLDHVPVVEILLKSSSSREAGQPCSITSSFFKLSLM